MRAEGEVIFCYPPRDIREMLHRKRICFCLKHPESAEKRREFLLEIEKTERKMKVVRERVKRAFLYIEARVAWIDWAQIHPMVERRFTSPRCVVLWG